jgi:hypothetical protein
MRHHRLQWHGQQKASTYPAGVRWIPSASAYQMRSFSGQEPLVACCACVSSAASAGGSRPAACSGAVLFAFVRFPGGRYAGWASLPPPQPAAIRQLVDAVLALAEDPGPANLTRDLARAGRSRTCAAHCLGTAVTTAVRHDAHRQDPHPLAEAGGVFAGLPAVDGWRQDGPATYVLSVSEQAVAAPAATRALVAAGAEVLSISQSRHSLEDVYLELIDQDNEAAGRRWA